MGVDYEVCENCQDTFPDCGDYVMCGCGKRWCSDSCAEADGYERKYDEEENHEEMSCSYCRGEDVEDYKLLEAFLHMTKMTRKEAVEWYLKVQEKKNDSH